MKSNRVVAYLAVLFLPSLGLYLAIGRLSDLTVDAVTFVWLYAALFALYALAVVPVLRTRGTSRGLLVIIIGAAIVFRLVAVFSPPFLSNDVYRYAWEGRVQKAGLAPYQYAPNDKALAKLRAEGGYLEIRNAKKGRSVYPPVAQTFFYAAAFAGKYNVTTIKALLAILDIATIFLLLGLTRRLKRADSLIILYAWSPLAVLEISGTGHIDGLAVFFITAAAYLALSKRSFLAGGLAGLASAAKIYPIIVLPAFTNRRDWRPLTGAALFGTAAYLPFIISGGLFFPIGTEAATAGPKFNAGLKTVVEWICGGPGPGVDTAYMLLTLAVLAAACGYFWLKQKERQDMIRAAYILLGMLIVFLPFTVPWYLVLILPFAALEAAPAFFYLSGTVMMSYLFYAYQPWSLPDWVRMVEFVPFAVLIGWEILTRDRVARRLEEPTFS
ncbi:MAG: glycosyltransferase family 87 protein [Actinomycetota bacterium]